MICFEDARIPNSSSLSALLTHIKFKYPDLIQGQVKNLIKKREVIWSL